MKHVKLFEQFVNNSTETVNENKYAKAGKLGYNDQFLNKRSSLSKTLALDLGLDPKNEFTGPWLGFDYVSLYATGKNGGTILADALTGKYTYDELRAAAAEFLGVKESVVNEARVNTQGFEDDFAELTSICEEEADYQELSDENIAFLISAAWREIAEQNNFDELMSDMSFALDRAKVKKDSNFHGVDIAEYAEEFGAEAYGHTGYTAEGMIECFNAVYDIWKFCKPAQWKNVIKSLEGGLKTMR